MTDDKWTFETSKTVENLTSALANTSLVIRHLEEVQRKAGSSYFGKELEDARGLYNAIARQLDELVMPAASAAEVV